MAISGADAFRPIGTETRVTASRPGRSVGKDAGRKPPPAPASSAAAVDDGAENATQPRRPVRLPEFAHHDIVFRHDKDLNRIIVEVVDAETREVVRTIPPEEVIDVLKNIRRAQGALLDEEA